jgi:hypothetical protein
MDLSKIISYSYFIGQASKYDIKYLLIYLTNT